MDNVRMVAQLRFFFKNKNGFFYTEGRFTVFVSENENCQERFPNRYDYFFQEIKRCESLRCLKLYVVSSTFNASK